MKKYLFIIWFLYFAGLLSAQNIISETDSVISRLEKQLVTFPHEKLYVQTDKANYLSGERIWLRSHLVDATLHIPTFFSRYVYVELFNPFDELIKRIKIRPDSIGVYSGHIDLEEELAEGSYTLRAYTRYMQNRGNEAFFKKTINVLDPYSLQIASVPNFVVNENKVDASFQFVNRQSGETVIPEIVTFQLLGEKVKTMKSQNNSDFRETFTLPKNRDNRNLLISIIHDGRKYNKYYPIPYADDDFEVSLHPEGGYLITDRTCQVGFKAINPAGLGEDISGVLFNSKDEEIVKFNSLKLGMGVFSFTPQVDEKYYVVCETNNGNVKRVDLPSSTILAKTLKVTRDNNHVLVYMQKGDAAPQDSLSLLIHNKGLVMYHEPWVLQTGSYNFPENGFPSGISSILLLDSNNDIISERLIFNINNEDFASLKSKLSSPTYKRRQHIALTLHLPDTDNLSINDNIAISVTDKNTVIKDTTNNLISTLLLSSELKGYIESPASYFSGNSEGKTALDVLMMTQGWRRYDIPNILKGKIDTPKILPEKFQEISGKAEARLLRSTKGGVFSLYATLDSLIDMETTTADKEGRFLFKTEYPEGTEITVQSLGKSGTRSNMIHINPETFPDHTLATLPVRIQSFTNADSEFDMDAYLKQADEAYLQKYGIRTIMLDEVKVTAQRVQQFIKSEYYSPIFSSRPTTSEEIDKLNISNMTSLLLNTSGITLRNGTVTTTRSELPALIVIDDVVVPSMDILGMSVDDIDNLFVTQNTAMFGYYPGTSGALVITTKDGSTLKSKSLNIDRVIPLGYQQSAEFYSPKYETKEQVDSSAPDLRTTIYWKPNVQFSNTGEAIVEFYSADTPTIYQVTGEGVTSSGKIYQYTEEIVIESSIK